MPSDWLGTLVAPNVSVVPARPHYVDAKKYKNVLHTLSGSKGYLLLNIIH